MRRTRFDHCACAVWRRCRRFSSQVSRLPAPSRPTLRRFRACRTDVPICRGCGRTSRSRASSAPPNSATSWSISDAEAGGVREGISQDQRQGSPRWREPGGRRTSLQRLLLGFGHAARRGQRPEAHVIDRRSAGRTHSRADTGSAEENSKPATRVGQCRGRAGRPGERAALRSVREPGGASARRTVSAGVRLELGAADAPDRLQQSLSDCADARAT